MRLKSTLWALAFAVAAVSCSDDLEEGGGTGTGGNELKGETAKINVTVNAATQTKALEYEVGSKDESEVNEVILVLYNNTDASTSSPSTTDYDLKTTSNIVAVGYTNSGIENDQTSDATHAWKATVEVTVTEESQALAGNTFGVLAITNVGDDSDLYSKLTSTNEGTKIKTVEALGDALITTVYNSTDKNDFVMSTHMIKNTSGSYLSTVTLNTGDTPADVEVYVERLAAKIRINEQTEDPIVNDFLYTLSKTVEGVQENVTDKILLNKVAVVNQLTSGSYLLKRTIAPTSKTDLSIPAKENPSKDVYLGEEDDPSGGAAAYVIDPWTRSKLKGSNPLPTFSSTQLDYLNRYVKGHTFEDYFGQTIDDKYTTIDLANNTLFTDQNHSLDLCYTMENTIGNNADLKGFATGAVFQATYYPGKWIEADADKGITKISDVNYGTEGSSVLVAAVTKDTKGKTFYANSDQINPKIYKDLTAIFAEYVANVKDVTLKSSDKENTVYTQFLSSNITNITIDNYKKSVFYNSNGDALGYIAYLNKAIDENSLTAFTVDHGFDKYIENESTWDDKKKATVYAEFKPYKDGACVYDYWIQHIPDNGTTDAGVMEYAIVRNNIYDMTIKGINTLGLSMVEVPDEDEEIESKELRMNVVIHVRNWVVRSNSDIIL